MPDDMFADGPDFGPQDDPFLEHLFDAICQGIAPLPGEDFAGLAVRWGMAFDFLRSLDPRDEDEWCEAAKVTVRHCAAAWSLCMAEQPDLTRRERALFDREHAANSSELIKAYVKYARRRAADLR